MSLSSETLVAAFAPPPPGVKLYRRTWRYSAADALTDIRVPGYLPALADGMEIGDYVMVTSHHPEDGCENELLVVRQVEGGQYQLQHLFEGLEASPE